MAVCLNKPPRGFWETLINKRYGELPITDEKVLYKPAKPIWRSCFTFHLPGNVVEF